MPVFALCLGLIVLGQSPPPPPTLEDVRNHLDGLATKGFRGMVYVEQGGKEAFFHTVGYAVPEWQKPFTRESLFNIGSIVKPMVRVAVLRLQAEGKLKLSDTITKYFDNVPDDKRGITLQLLSEHRAGFKDVFGGDYQPMERDELMKQMLASELIYTPGEKNVYSNSGFSMLATVIEKVTGKPIEHVIAEFEFKPLGLTKTGYALPKWNKEDLAIQYRANGERWGSMLDHFRYADGPSWNQRGNGGMLSTVRELARWVRGLHEFEILSEADHKTLVPALHAEDGDRRIWGAAGGDDIFNTAALYNRRKRMTLIACSFDGRFHIENDRELTRVVYRMLPELPAN